MQSFFRVFEELVFFDFWIPDSGFRFPDSGFPIPDSRLRIPVYGSEFRIPDSGFLVLGLPGMFCGHAMFKIDRSCYFKILLGLRVDQTAKKVFLLT